MVIVPTLRFRMVDSERPSKYIGRLNLMLLKELAGIYHKECRKRLAKSWQVGKSFSKMPIVTNYDIINLTLENMNTVDELGEGNRNRILSILRILLNLKESKEELKQKLEKASLKFEEFNANGETVEIIYNDYNELILKLVKERTLQSWDEPKALEEELKDVMENNRFKFSGCDVKLYDHLLNGLISKILDSNEEEEYELNRNRALNLAKRATKAKQEKLISEKPIKPKSVPKKKEVKLDKEGFVEGFKSGMVVDRFVVSKNFIIDDNMGAKNFELMKNLVEVCLQQLDLELAKTLGEFNKGRFSEDELKAYSLTVLSAMICKSLKCSTSTGHRKKAIRLLIVFSEYDSLETFTESYEEAMKKLYQTKIEKATINFSILKIFSELLELKYESSLNDYNSFREEIVELMKVSRLEISKHSNSGIKTPLGKLYEEVKNLVDTERENIKNSYLKNKKVEVKLNSDKLKAELRESIKTMDLGLRS